MAAAVEAARKELDQEEEQNLANERELANIRREAAIAKDLAEAKRARAREVCHPLTPSWR